MTDRLEVKAALTVTDTGEISGLRFIARKRVGADVTHPDRFVKLQVAA